MALFGEGSEIIIPGPGGSRPQSIIIRTWKDDNPVLAGPYDEKEECFKLHGFGLCWEADHVARQLKGICSIIPYVFVRLLLINVC